MQRLIISVKKILIKCVWATNLENFRGQIPAKVWQQRSSRLVYVLQYRYRGYSNLCQILKIFLKTLYGIRSDLFTFQTLISLKHAIYCLCKNVKRSYHWRIICYIDSCIHMLRNCCVDVLKARVRWIHQEFILQCRKIVSQVWEIFFVFCRHRSFLTLIILSHVKFFLYCAVWVAQK